MVEAENNFELRFAAWQFKSMRGQFYSDLASSMDAAKGEPITKFLYRYGERYGKEPAGILCKHWLRRFDHVGRFSEAVRGTIPDEDLTALSVSESAGDLKVGLRSLGKNIVGLDQCKKEIFGVLIVALVLVLVLHAFLYIESWHVMPKLEAAVSANLDVAKLGTIGDILFTGAHEIRSWWWLWLTFVASSIAIVKWSLPNYVGRMRPWLDEHILPFQMYRDFNGASFFASIGSITGKIGSQTVTLHDALSKMRDDAYPWLRWQIIKIQENISERPNTQGEIFNTGITNKKSYYRILDIADYAEMSVMLNTVGDIILKTAPEETKKRAAVVRYVLLLTCISIMFGVYGGTFVLIDKFKQQVQLNAM